MTEDAVRPEDYRRWRASPLGSATERIEQALVFRLSARFTTDVNRSLALLRPPGRGCVNHQRRNAER